MGSKDTVAQWTDEGAVRPDYDEVFAMGFNSGWKAALYAAKEVKNQVHARNNTKLGKAAHKSAAEKK